AAAAGDGHRGGLRRRRRPLRVGEAGGRGHRRGRRGRRAAAYVPCPARFDAGERHARLGLAGMMKVVPGVAAVPVVALLSAVLAVAAPAKPPLVADAASVCDSCAEWNADRQPFQIFGNTYYVGVAG